MEPDLLLAEFFADRADQMRDGKVSGFDRAESMAIAAFAEWLVAHYNLTPKEGES